MYALDFIYDSKKLSDFDMIICKFDSSGLETVSSGADITFNQIKPSGSNKFNLYSANYDNAYSATFQICINPSIAKSNSDLHISSDLLESVQKWLCRKEYHKFSIDQDGYSDIYWNGTFSTKQINLNGYIIGMELALYTDAPFAYKKEISMTYNCTTNQSFTVSSLSDEEGYIYPSLKITILSSGNFTLSNSRDNRTMKISNCTVNEVITIDGTNQIISSNISSHNIEKDFNYFFPRIITTYDNNSNIYTSNLNCIIEMNYSPIAKIGL